MKKNSLEIPKGTEILIMDTPAGVTDKRLSKFLDQAQTMVMPILASSIDIRATELEHYLTHITLPNRKKLPFTTMLRASQNYIRTAEHRLSILN